jgi:uncharacterized FlaG/YvyC family protein
MRVEADLPLDYDSGSKGIKAVENKPLKAQPDSPAVAKTTDLDYAVGQLNRFFCNYNLQFTMHQASGRYQVKMIDSVNHEVIREWPADAILEISARLKQVLEQELGILLDTHI